MGDDFNQTPTTEFPHTKSPGGEKLNLFPKFRNSLPAALFFLTTLVVVLLLNLDSFPYMQYKDINSLLSLPDSFSHQRDQILEDEHKCTVSRQLDNNCWARSELNQVPNNYLSHLNSSQLLKDRLREYSEHHKNCISAVHNWTAVIGGEESVVDPNTGEVCRFLLTEVSSRGLGNQFLTLVAALAYSLLTNRVLLTTSWHITDMLCEPFPGSNWFLNNTYCNMAKKDAMVQADFCTTDEVWSQKRSIVRAAVQMHVDNPTVTDHNFFCEESQKRLQSVPWLTLTTEQFFVPGLQLLPSFRRQLEALFPDLKVFAHLSRFLLLPNNHMWERITRLYSMHFQNVDTRIGVQVRTFLDEDHYAHNRVLGCLVNVSKVLAPPIAPKVWKQMWKHMLYSKENKSAVDEVVSLRNPRKVLVFVTTIHNHHAMFLHNLYTDGVSMDGNFVNVHSYPASGEEIHTETNDMRAFTEMMLLSFCETQLTSFFSTFGYVSAGLAGVRPYLMNIVSEERHVFAEPFQRNGRPLCELSVSSEPCFHAVPHLRQCNITLQVPHSIDKIPAYIQGCQDASFGYRVDPLLATVQE